MAADRTTPHGRANAESSQAQAAAAGHEALAPRIARNILLFLLCSFVFTGILNIPADNPGDIPGNAGSYICMAIVFALQLVHSSPRAPGWPLRVRLLTLGVQAVATFLPIVVFHEIWGGMAGFLGGSFILLLRRPLSWVLFAACPLSMMWLGADTHQGAAWIAYLGVATANTALVIYGLTKLTDLVSKLHEARAELARLAVARERQRFSRDLHDLLGYSLSSITLKSELAYRLADGQAERTRGELASILEISRQALSDLRTVASSYRDLSFCEEVGTVESMLLATGVDVSVEVSLPELPPVVDTVFATVLREGVTNMLRHSKVEHCSITGRAVNGEVRLELVNDGVGAESEDAADPVGSSGLGSLAQRLAAIGGQLSAGVRSDATFQLVAQAPLRKGRAVAERAAPVALSGSRAEPARPAVDLRDGE